MNTRGQNLNYSYDAAGQVTRIDDAAIGQITDYSYDHAGNKVRERTAQGGGVYQNNIMAYDALGDGCGRSAQSKTSQKPSAMQRLREHPLED